MKQVIVGLIVLIMCGCSGATVDGSLIKIYYIPFNAETFVPVTVEDIEESSSRYGELSESGELDKLLDDALNGEGAGDFDLLKVRAKIVYPNGEITYIDSYGVVLTSDGRTFSLDDDSFSKLGLLMDRITS